MHQNDNLKNLTVHHYIHSYIAYICYQALQGTLTPGYFASLGNNDIQKTMLYCLFKAYFELLCDLKK